jgi:hypothetical protein
MPRAVLQAPMEAGDEEARQHPRQAATVLERVSGTSATVEPRVLNPQDDADRGHQSQQARQHVALFQSGSC